MLLLMQLQEGFEQGDMTARCGIWIYSAVLHMYKAMGKNSLIWHFIAKCSKSMFFNNSYILETEQLSPNRNRAFLLTLNLLSTYNNGSQLSDHMISHYNHKKWVTKDARERAIKQKSLSQQLDSVYNNLVPVLGKGHMSGIITQFN